MSLYYITRVGIPSQAAQSVQIASMCKAFHGLLGKDFKFISSLSKNNTNLTKDYDWEKIETVFAGGVFKYLVFSVKVFFKLLKDRPTHIYSRDIIIALIGQKLGMESVYETHQKPNSLMAKLILKYLLKKSNFRLVCISHTLKSYYINHYWAANDKIFVCHDGVFFEEYDELRKLSKNELRKSLGLAPDRKVVLYTGSLYKGNDSKLFEPIVRNFGEVLFISIGGSASEIEEHENHYSEFDNITFLPHTDRSEVIKYQMAADLLFFPLARSNPIWWCASPMKLFEYMATGRPILASNIGSVGEVLNENNAIIFDPENENTIIEGVKYFLNQQDQSMQLARQALADVREKYTWDKRVEHICDFLGLTDQEVCGA